MYFEIQSTFKFNRIKMEKHIKKQVGVVLRIWITALIVNTICGTAVLTGFFSNHDLVKFILGLGLFYGFLFSLPVALLFFLVMRISIANEMNGRMLFVYLLIAGIALTTLAFGLFVQWLGSDNRTLPLCGCALFSVLLGVCLHYRPILNIGHRPAHAEITFSEMDI